MSIVTEFDACGIHYKWINGVSKVGYLSMVASGRDAFVKVWTVAELVGQFLRTDDGIKAEAVGYHYCEMPDKQPEMFVLPRYDKDYEDNNEVYAIVEAEQQAATSSPEIIHPLAKRLEEYLAKMPCEYK